MTDADNTSHDALDEDFDPVAGLSGPLMRKVLADVAKERLRQDGDMGIMRDYHDGSGGRMVSGPTLSRDRERTRETLRALKQAEGTSRMTWRHLAEDSFALAMAADNDRDLRKMLLSVAAHSVAWIEAIDRRKDEKRIERKMKPTLWQRVKAWFKR